MMIPLKIIRMDWFILKCICSKMLRVEKLLLHVHNAIVSSEKWSNLEQIKRKIQKNFKSKRSLNP